MTRRVLAFAALMAAAGAASAQDYNTGIGLRGGFTNGVTVKHFIANATAVEGILGFGFRSFKLTGLYQIYKPAFNVDRLYWYYGFGAHFGYYNFPSCGKWRWNGLSWEKIPSINCIDEGIGVGIDGILGIEYHISDIPFTVSFDIKPSLEYNTLGYLPFYFWDAGFSIRYVF